MRSVYLVYKCSHMVNGTNDLIYTFDSEEKAKQQLKELNFMDSDRRYIIIERVVNDDVDMAPKAPIVHATMSKVNMGIGIITSIKTTSNERIQEDVQRRGKFYKHGINIYTTTKSVFGAYSYSFTFPRQSNDESIEHYLDRARELIYEIDKKRAKKTDDDIFGSKKNRKDELDGWQER